MDLTRGERSTPRSTPRSTSHPDGDTSSDTRSNAGSVLHFAAEWLAPSEVFVYDLVRSLERRGVVLAGEPLENTDRFPHPRLYSLAPLEAIVPMALRSPVVTGALGILGARHGVRIVHAHHGYRSDQLVGFVRRRRVPFVVSLHGHDLTGYLVHHPDAYRRVAPLSSAVVVPSRFLASYALAAGFAEDRIRVMPSGVDTRYFSPTPLPQGPPEALFVGRFVAKKGLDVLADAWPQVAREVPGARLRVLGFGPLESLARSIDKDVEVILSPDRRQVRDAMRRATVVVSPSKTADDDSVESLLMVNLEAQASARAVVTTDHGAIPEYVSRDVTALVVAENDPRSLAQALVSVLSDRGLARRLGAAGPAYAKHLDIRCTARAMDDLYDELLDRPRISKRAT